MTESGEAIQPRIVEIIEEFHDDRDQSGELQALTNLARALVKAEAASAAPPEREVPAARIIRQVRRALGPLDDPATYGDISYEGPRHADCSVEGCPEHWPVAAPPEPPRPYGYLSLSQRQGRPLPVAAPERLPLNVERLREAMSNVMSYRHWDEGYPEQVAAEYARLSESDSPPLDPDDAEERVIGRKCIACDNILIGGECPIHGDLTLRGESDSPTSPPHIEPQKDCWCNELAGSDHPTPPPDCVGTHAPSEVCPQCDDGSKDLNASAMSAPTPPGEER